MAAVRSRALVGDDVLATPAQLVKQGVGDVVEHVEAGWRSALVGLAVAGLFTAVCALAANLFS